MKKTKILATVGPSSFDENIIRKMDESGVDLFRINLSHTAVENYPVIIKRLQSWTKKPISTDVEGAQIRTGKIENGAMELQPNAIVNLTFSPLSKDESVIPLYPHVEEQVLKVGDILHIDFNAAVVQIIRVDGLQMKGRALSGGKIGSNKGVGVDRIIRLPFLTEKDRRILEISREMQLKNFALSFAWTGENVKDFRALFPYPIHLISKIESRIGMMNLEEICRESDEILIDRGDLSKEISITRISIAQKYIIEKARKLNTRVHIATNLLDTMMEADLPSRAEINDMTSSLLDGASGLVLAAETAIGKNPVKSVRLVHRVMNEIESYKENFLHDIHVGDSFEYNLIEPHGGFLVQNFANVSEQELQRLPKLKVNRNVLMDCMQIAEGAYSPLRGFMGSKELHSVLDDLRLPSGHVWTLPILLQISATDAERLKTASEALIVFDEDDEVYARIKINEISKLEHKETVAQKWFMTKDRKHPGMSYFLEQGDYIVDCEVFLIKKLDFGFESYELTPRQTRQLFHKNLWRNVVGFHTRNIVHRGHEFIQKQAAKSVGADCIFISPVVGQKKKGDFTGQAIVAAYQAMLQNNFYQPSPVVLGTFNTYSRYSGPRESIFTALCRKNFGCSHFIIGRDHTGVGDYYKSIDLQAYADQAGDLGVELIFFDNVVYREKDGVMTMETLKNGSANGYKPISGTLIRNYLQEGKAPPSYLVRPEIVEEVLNLSKTENGKIFEE